jgi:hypothetical protein
MTKNVTTEFSGQQERILDLFKSRGYWGWVERYEFLDLQPRICDFTTRIFELRHKRDLNIQCETKTVNGEKHSRYRLLPGSYRELRGKPESEGRKRREPPTVPVKSWDEIVREREHKLSAAPVFELTP